MTMNNCRLKFADRAGPATIQCFIDGGNLVAIDSVGDPLNPVEPSTFTQVVRELDVSAALIQSNEILEVEKILKNRTETNPTTGVMTVYDDDDVTPLLTGNVFEDVAATQPYRGQGADRRDKLS